MSQPTSGPCRPRAAGLPERALLAGALVGVGALLTACGAGQRAETSREFSTITAANAETADRTISVRAAYLEVQGDTTRGYLTVVNGGSVADALIGATSDEAASVTITRQANFTASPTTSLPIPVGARVDLAPGGSYLQLNGVKTQLRVGEVVRVTLSFASAGSVTLGLPVQPHAGAVIAPSSGSASPAGSPSASPSS